MKKPVLGLLILLLCQWLWVPATQAQSPTGPTLSAEEAVARALQQNFSIRIQQLEEQFAKNNVTRGAAGQLPVIDAVAQYNVTEAQLRQEFLNPNIAPINVAGTNQVASAGVNLNWTIFDGFAMFIAYDRLKEIHRLGQENVKAVVDNSVANVLSTYYNIIRQKDLLKVFKEAMLVSRARMELAQARYDAGTDTKMNYLFAQVDLNADSSAYIRQVQILQNAMVDLNTQLVQQPDYSFATPDTFTVDKELDYTGIQQQMESLNPLMLQAQRANNIAYLDERQQRSFRYPSVFVTGGYQYTRQLNEAGFARSIRNRNWVYGVGAGWRLFDGDNNNRLIQGARIRQEITKMEQDQTLLNLNADLRKAWIDYQNSLALLDLERSNVKVARQNVDIVQDRYKIGVATPIEFREAQRSAIAAQGRVIDALYQAKLAEIELQRLSGGIVRGA